MNKFIIIGNHDTTELREVLSNTDHGTRVVVVNSNKKFADNIDNILKSIDELSRKEYRTIVLNQ